MRRSFLIALLLLAGCASNDPMPNNIVAQSDNKPAYRTDLAYCQNWAAPTRNEWATRCSSNGELVMWSHIIASLSPSDPRDQDTQRQSLPNDTQARFTACMNNKGYAINTAGNDKIASR